MNRKDFIYQSSTLLGGMILADYRKFFRGDARSVRFGVISDLHYADNDPVNDNNRYYRESIEKLRECVQVMNKEKVDFLIQLGDFKDQDNDNPDEEKTLEYLRTINDEFEKFEGPKYHVLGNHDHDSISKQQFLDNISIHGLKHSRSFYSFDLNGFHFIVLDGNFKADGQAYDHGNFDWKEAYIPQNQRKWLQEDLRGTDSPTVIFVHQRLDRTEENKAYCIQNSDQINEIIHDSGKAVLVMQGHYHPGDITRDKGLNYYTIRGAITGSGLENNSFAIVDIDSKLNMKVTGYRRASTESF